MKYKTFSRDELTDFLTNGIPMPESAKTDENTIDFYFEELESFINSAENAFFAKSTDYLEITIEVNDIDFLILRYNSGTVIIYLANTRPDIINTMTADEASDVIGIVYGVTIYNEKWVEINELIDEFTDDIENDKEYNVIKEMIDPKLLEKHKKSPNNYEGKILKMNDYEKYFKKDTKKIYK